MKFCYGLHLILDIVFFISTYRKGRSCVDDKAWNTFRAHEIKLIQLFLTRCVMHIIQRKETAKRTKADVIKPAKILSSLFKILFV